METDAPVDTGRTAETDSAVTAGCKSGIERACGTNLGRCSVGVELCEDGVWGLCNGDGPSSEECDGEDNDCDGDIDEGCECRNEATRPCGTDVGECTAGMQQCSGRSWGHCAGSTGPDAETCDGKDNDCDGDIDEGCECLDQATRPCGTDVGECVAGTQQCIGRFWGNCSENTGPEVETCDGKDNDCDGDIDEGCECQNQATRACGSSVGECAAGTQRCVGRFWGECSGSIGPEAETCDGEDNNCNGDIDEGCECSHGATRPCGTAVGTCELGEQRCTNGTWGSCASNQMPQPELCDGLDNDCDGTVDNGFDLGLACNTAGGCPQLRVCSDDRQSSVCRNDERLFTSERCDGIDNDCNGLVDQVMESGSLRSVCSCETRPLNIGDAVNASISDNPNLCAPTRCGGDRIPGRSLDGTCWTVCESTSDADGDGWSFEDGESCLVAGGTPWRRGTQCEGEGIPTGMAIQYCLDCSGTDNLPFAMCESLPRFDLSAFARGDMWLRVDFTYGAETPSPAPVNLWFTTGEGRRKHLPLVKVGERPGRYQRTLRVEEACFRASEIFGSACPSSGQPCSHCGSDEVCGAIAPCGDYDLREAWLQVAAEFCGPGVGRHAGSVTVHQIELVEPNCGD